MKIICTRDNLRLGITRTERSVGKNPTLPILGNILLEAENGLLKMSSTNLEIGVSNFIRAKIEREGKITVPATVFSGLIHNLKDEQITLELESQNLKVTSANFESKLRTIPADDFPLIPKVEEGRILETSGKKLAEAIRRVLPSVATMETKLELTGICFTISSGKISLAATDGYRLAEKIINTSSKEEEGLSFIAPSRSVQEVERLFGEEEGNVKIIISESQIAFQKEDLYFVSRLIEGQYPDYKQIIPESFKAKVKISKTELINSLKLAGIFSLTQTKDIKIKLEDDKIALHAVSGELGEHHAILAADVEGEKIEVSFNHQFLQDGLNSIPEEDIIFSLNGSESPSMIRGIDNKSKEEVSDFLYIVMPIRQ